MLPLNVAVRYAGFTGIYGAFFTHKDTAYTTRSQGKGSKHQIWNTFGWIYDTSVAMVHIALAGVFRRYPGLRPVGVAKEIEFFNS